MQLLEAASLVLGFPQLIFQLANAVLLLMIDILHDLIYQNPRKSGSMLHIMSCRICTINSSAHQCFELLHGMEKALLNEVLESLLNEREPSLPGCK